MGQSARDRPPVWIRRAVLCGLLALVFVWLILISASLMRAKADVDRLNAMRGQSLSTISPDTLSGAASSFQSLHENLIWIDRLSALPGGRNWPLGRLPWLGPRYESARALIGVGLHLSDAGAVGSETAAQSLAAYQSTGLTQPAPAGTLTWLDVLKASSPTLDRVMRDLSSAENERAKIDSAVLPAFIQAKLSSLDSGLARYDELGISSGDDRLALLRGLGSDGPVRYLVLFQNPAELRPSGGFPGTMALVTFDRGQLVSSTFFDAHTLTNDYINQRKTKRPEPWPIDHFFPQDGFLLHDAGWYADFPTAASTMMSMYAETNWPSISGVIAVQPSGATDLLNVTGPVDVEIDGELRHVTAENVYDEIERQRRLIVEGIKPWDKTREVHKEALADIGEAILAKMKTANRQQLIQAAKLLESSADVRDIQVYSADPTLESLADQRGWTGRLNPKPDTPTMAITFANVALQKSSEFMHPSLNFTVSPASSGRRTLTLEITVDNRGPLGENPIYSGFQNWWIQVGLPQGFDRLSSSAPTQPDPDAPDGGAYVVGINPQQSHSVTVVFSMPASEAFLLRRQPGLTTAQVSVTDSSCGSTVSFALDQDRTVDVHNVCHP